MLLQQPAMPLQQPAMPLQQPAMPLAMPLNMAQPVMQVEPANLAMKPADILPTVTEAPDGRPFLSSPAGNRYLKRKASGGADDYHIQTCPDGRAFLRSPSAGTQAWVDEILNGTPGSWPEVAPKATGSTCHVALVEHEGRGFTLNLGMVAVAPPVMPPVMPQAMPKAMATLSPLPPPQLPLWDAPGVMLPDTVLGVASPGWPLAKPLPMAGTSSPVAPPVGQLTGHEKFQLLLGPQGPQIGKAMATASLQVGAMTAKPAPPPAKAGAAKAGAAKAGAMKAGAVMPGGGTQAGAVGVKAGAVMPATGGGPGGGVTGAEAVAGVGAVAAVVAVGVIEAGQVVEAGVSGGAEEDPPVQVGAAEGEAQQDVVGAGEEAAVQEEADEEQEVEEAGAEAAEEEVAEEAVVEEAAAEEVAGEAEE